MKRTNEVSKLVGVSRRTLQYYDDEGMLAVERSQTNHRLYDQQALERIWRILIYKEMRVELREIKQILSMSDDAQREYFRMRIHENEEKIRKLQGQNAFIARISAEGMPQKPEENEGVTYTERIQELRKNQRRK